MASMSFDFNKITRSFLTITLKNETEEDQVKGTVLLVKMPMKKTFEKMTALQDVDTDSMTANDAMDTMGGLVAEILSHNMSNTKITTKYITDHYDIEEMEELIDNYMNFVSGVKNNPN